VESKSPVKASVRDPDIESIAVSQSLVIVKRSFSKVFLNLIIAKLKALRIKSSLNPYSPTSPKFVPSTQFNGFTFEYKKSKIS